MPGKFSGYKKRSFMSTEVWEEELCQWLEKALVVLEQADLLKHVRCIVVSVLKQGRKDLIDDVKLLLQEKKIKDPTEVKRLKLNLNGQSNLDDLRKSLLEFQLQELTNIPAEEARCLVKELISRKVALEEVSAQPIMPPVMHHQNHAGQPSKEKPISRSEPVSRSEQESSYANAFPALLSNGNTAPLSAYQAESSWEQRCPLSTRLTQKGAENTANGVQYGKAADPFKRLKCNGKENEAAYGSFDQKKRPKRKGESASPNHSQKNGKENRYGTNITKAIMQFIAERQSNKPSSMRMKLIENGQRSQEGAGYPQPEKMDPTSEEKPALVPPDGVQKPQTWPSEAEQDPGDQSTSSWPEQLAPSFTQPQLSSTHTADSFPSPDYSWSIPNDPLDPLHGTTFVAASLSSSFPSAFPYPDLAPFFLPSGQAIHPNRQPVSSRMPFALERTSPPRSPEPSVHSVPNSAGPFSSSRHFGFEFSLSGQLDGSSPTGFGSLSAELCKASASTLSRRGFPALQPLEDQPSEPAAPHLPNIQPISTCSDPIWGRNSPGTVAGWSDVQSLALFPAMQNNDEEDGFQLFREECSGQCLKQETENGEPDYEGTGRHPPEDDFDNLGLRNLVSTVWLSDDEEELPVSARFHPGVSAIPLAHQNVGADFSQLCGSSPVPSLSVSVPLASVEGTVSPTPQDVPPAFRLQSLFPCMSCPGACNCLSGGKEGDVRIDLSHIRYPTCLANSNPSSSLADRNVTKCASDSQLYLSPREGSAFHQNRSWSSHNLPGTGQLPMAVGSGAPLIRLPIRLVEKLDREQCRKLERRHVPIIKEDPFTSSYHENEIEEAMEEEEVQVPDTSFLLQPDIFGMQAAVSFHDLPSLLQRTSKLTQTDKLLEEELLDASLPEVSPSNRKYVEKTWKEFDPLTTEDLQKDELHALTRRPCPAMPSNGIQVSELESDAVEYHQAAVTLMRDTAFKFVESCHGMFASDNILSFSDCPALLNSSHVYEAWILERMWLNDSTSGRRRGKDKEKVRRPLHPNKPCTYFLEGCCYRTDCKYSHDFSTITCHFWEDKECFKGDHCPFLHGYYRVTKGSGVAEGFEVTQEEFPELGGKDSHGNGPKKKKHLKKHCLARAQLPAVV